MSIPKILLAATKSGSGKTLITCALLNALVQRKMKVAAFKCGPDYIDPMFHEKVIGVPSGNLDLYFTDENVTRELFYDDNDSDISVIEGVMGLYDGLGGISEEASAYHLSKVIDAPIILIVNAHGMGRSVVAEIAGFLAYDKEKRIKGIILNQISENFYNSILPVINEELGIEVFGFFPTKKDLQLDSRYLGLKLPGEVADLKGKVSEAAELLEKYVNVDRLIQVASENKENALLDGSTANAYGSGDNRLIADIKQSKIRLRIGIAYDEAFCFYYRANLKMLEKLGAEIVRFSPLHDKKLPNNLDGIILGGGYPELVAKELSENTEMIECIKKAIDSEIPSLAECGGFMYLHDTITTKNGEVYPLVSVIKGDCHDTGKLVRFGYAQFTDPEKKWHIKGHEFHYFDSDNCGEDFYAEKPLTAKKWRCMHYSDNHLWGYGHMFYPSEPKFVQWFLEKCLEYHRGRI